MGRYIFSVSLLKFREKRCMFTKLFIVLMEIMIMRILKVLKHPGIDTTNRWKVHLK